MRRGPRYYLGILLVIAAGAGLLISVAGILGVWRLQATMKVGLAEAITLLEATLQATGDGLKVAGQSLTQADEALDTLAETIETAGQSLGETVPLIESLTQVTSTDLPQTILTTQSALESAQASAQVVDSTLSLLTAIPLLPIAPYQPAVSLSEALQGVSASLDPIPASLSSMEQSLGNTAENLLTLERQLDDIAASVLSVTGSLSGAQDVLTQYTQVVARMQQQLALARTSLPLRLDTIAWFVTVVLVWLGLTQLGLLLQGFDLLGFAFLKRPQELGSAPPAGAAPDPPPNPGASSP